MTVDTYTAEPIWTRGPEAAASQIVAFVREAEGHRRGPDAQAATEEA